MAKVLVIEDQEATWEILLSALVRECHIEPKEIERARFYTEAEEKIRTGSYTVVLLDHRMPRTDPGCTDKESFKRFAEQIQSIGYGLLPLLEEYQPQATVIGTTSLSKVWLGEFKLPSLQIHKLRADIELPPIIKHLL